MEHYDDGYKQLGDMFAYTVKDNRVDCTDYRSFFDNSEKKGCSFYSKFKELDKKGKIHYHGIVFIPKRVYRKALCLKGLHLKLKEIFDVEGWEEYCKKDQEKELSDDPDEPIEMPNKRLFKVISTKC